MPQFNRPGRFLTELTGASQTLRDSLQFMDEYWKSLANSCDALVATCALPERNGERMNTRTKIAASGLLIAALAAAATPAFASGKAAHGAKPATGTTRGPVEDARMHGGPLASLVTAGTITQAQADAVETALHAAMDSSRTNDFNNALAALVANGTITQAQADAAKAPATATPGKDMHPNLDSWTVAQRDALHAKLDAIKPDPSVAGKAAVAKLVTAGTITQAQADAVNAAFAAAPVRADGDRGHGMGDRGMGGRGMHGAPPAAPTATAAPTSAA